MRLVVSKVMLSFLIIIEKFKLDFAALVEGV
ncbi:hypothetical protein PSYRMG_05710 [Pseudomonas syringae UMAF0158]|nr:hypothetical protein PSYRMG_05710 [Pseudomonas syringae UMAF0158]